MPVIIVLIDTFKKKVIKLQLFGKEMTQMTPKKLPIKSYILRFVNFLMY